MTSAILVQCSNQLSYQANWKLVNCEFVIYPWMDKENVFVAVKSERQKTKWKVKFKAYTALVAVNGTIFFLSALDIKRRLNKGKTEMIKT